MSIALAQEVKRLAVELAYLRRSVESQAEDIAALRKALVDLNIELDGLEVPQFLPAKRGPGRPPKVSPQ